MADYCWIWRAVETHFRSFGVFVISRISICTYAEHGAVICDAMQYVTRWYTALTYVSRTFRFIHKANERALNSAALGASVIHILSPHCIFRAAFLRLAADYSIELGRERETDDFGRWRM